MSYWVGLVLLGVMACALIWYGGSWGQWLRQWHTKAWGRGVVEQPRTTALRGYKVGTPLYNPENQVAGVAGATVGSVIAYGARGSATCASGFSHRCPAANCRCGFYAWSKLGPAKRYLSYDQGGVLLEVAATGLYRRYTEGIRYEHQRILSARFGDCRCGARASVLGYDPIHRDALKLVWSQLDLARREVVTTDSHYYVVVWPVCERCLRQRELIPLSFDEWGQALGGVEVSCLGGQFALRGETVARLERERVARALREH